MNDLQNWFHKLTRKTERLLFRLIVALLAFVFLAQALFFVDGFRRVVNRVELMEGIPYLEPGLPEAPGDGMER